MFNRASIVLGVVVAFVLSSSQISLGQEEPKKPKSLADDYVVGNWTVEGTVDGKAYKGSMQVRPSAGGVCLIFNWTYRAAKEEPCRGTAVGGRDPKTNDFFEYCFESDGAHFVNRYPGEAFPDTGVGYGERTGTINGKPYKGKITVDRRGRDHFIYSVDSEDGVDVKWVFRRIQEDKAKSAKK